MEKDTKKVYSIDVSFEIEGNQQKAVELLQDVEQFVRESGGELTKLELGQSPF